jgi:hypothetical protein
LQEGRKVVVTAIATGTGQKSIYTDFLFLEKKKAVTKQHSIKASG